MKLNELALKAGSFDKEATEFGAAHAEKWAQGEHVGDIEQLQVKRTDKFYSVWNDSRLVAYCSLKGDVVDDVWVDPAARGQKIFSKLFWFLRSRENRTRLIIGDVHSTNMQEVLKGLRSFKKSWLNTETNETEPFTADTSKYYKGSPLKWALMLENNEPFFSDWPRFSGGGFIKESYDWIIK